jgi:hypothetical protein
VGFWEYEVETQRTCIQEKRFIYYSRKIDVAPFEEIREFINDVNV